MTNAIQDRATYGTMTNLIFDDLHQKIKIIFFFFGQKFYLNWIGGNIIKRSSCNNLKDEYGIFV